MDSVTGNLHVIRFPSAAGVAATCHSQWLLLTMVNRALGVPAEAAEDPVVAEATCRQRTTKNNPANIAKHNKASVRRPGDGARLNMAEVENWPETNAASGKYPIGSKDSD
jgi:hypothetical protein